MKYIRTLFAVMGLVVAGGATSSAEDNSTQQRATLYTSPLAGDAFVCKAVNIGKRSLYIAFAILGDDGQPLPCPDCSPRPRFSFHRRQRPNQAFPWHRVTMDAARLTWSARTIVMIYG